MRLLLLQVQGQLQLHLGLCRRLQQWLVLPLQLRPQVLVQMLRPALTAFRSLLGRCPAHSGQNVTTF
jgi:hypothetical protein